MKKHKKLIAALCSLIIAASLFTGCSSQTRQRVPKTKELVSTDTLHITSQGMRTSVYDLAGDAEYNFTSHRVRKGSAPATTKTAADTETIFIQYAGGEIYVTDRTAGIKYTLSRGR